MARTFYLDDPKPEGPKEQGVPILWIVAASILAILLAGGVGFYFGKGRSEVAAKPDTRPAQAPQTGSNRKTTTSNVSHPTGAANQRSSGDHPASPFGGPSAFSGNSQPGQSPQTAPAHSMQTIQTQPNSGFVSRQAPSRPFGTQMPSGGYSAMQRNPGGVSPQDVIARVKQSVVLILAETYDGISSGTGFVVSGNQIGTCEHVIEGARRVVVICPDGRQVSGAVTAADPLNDVAVVTVNGLLPHPLQLGTYAQARDGDEIAVTGYPVVDTMLSVGFTPAPSTSRGSVSARRNRIIDGVSVPLIQMDASINPGNSGGPLYSLRDGTVYGVAAAAIRDSAGLGFASSVDALRRLLGW